MAWSFPGSGEKLEKTCRSYRKKRRGAAAVEFAVVAPLFFLLVFGLLEFGRMVMVQQVITNASREGARRAILSGATEEDVVSLVVEYLQKGAINVDSSAVSVDDLDQAESGDPITVTVTIPFNQVSWLPSPMFLGATELRASTVMRCESIE